MNWVDRVSLGVAIVIAFGVAGVTAVAMVKAPALPFTASDWVAVLVWAAKCEVYVALPLWLTLSVGNFLFGSIRDRKR